MSVVREDVAKLGPGWNTTMLNYALAMQELDKLPITDRNSWRFLAAMHGCSPAGWEHYGIVDSASDIPAELVGDARTYGKQCQHGSWYFLSWHRGYITAFEDIIAAKVKELTGDDWALPYWNYFDETNPDARKVPDSLLADTLPDGSDNPLRKYRQLSSTTALPNVPSYELGLEAMEEDDFLVGNDGSIGFGGGITDDFQHGYWMAGDLEANPHNPVHVMIGGYMGDPNYAALDPIFWLHHCNIDRLWEAWMNTPGKNMLSDPRWLHGPADRQFIVPQIGGADPGDTYSGKDTLKNGKFHRAYDDLTSGTGVTPGAGIVARVSMGPSSAQTVETIGADSQSTLVQGGATRNQIQLEPAAAADAVASMGATEKGETVSRLYLALEGVRGESLSPKIEVYVGLPEGADPADNPTYRAGVIYLFGLNLASDPHGDHGGNGLGYKLDITDVSERLKAEGKLDDGQIAVTVVAGDDVSEDVPITVERMVIYKRTGTVS